MDPCPTKIPTMHLRSNIFTHVASCWRHNVTWETNTLFLPANSCRRKQNQYKTSPASRNSIQHSFFATETQQAVTTSQPREDTWKSRKGMRTKSCYMQNAKPLPCHNTISPQSSTRCQWTCHTHDITLWAQMQKAKTSTFKKVGLELWWAAT